ncbi:unnamed protein product [Bursaphelenchus xylophilus]|uniref:DNA polymerase epsilon subunit 3 n=1 Tax=Bursaphelenchus xylophilus TaxID=6326 RepID=A0A1I7RSD5_BURXY|nr:unnamed protein product [Bursaphelenchus xylophilus]CAG9123031.1 unnamed protein product [Bursaphelenchus xylophilus]
MSDVDEANEFVEVLKLPQAPIDRIIKECLPAGFHASKETRTVFARAVAVFVLCLGTAASDNAKLGKRKTINVKDVKNALRMMRLDLPEIDELVERFIEQLETEKVSKADQTKNIEHDHEEELFNDIVENDSMNETDTRETSEVHLE